MKDTVKEFLESYEFEDTDNEELTVDDLDFFDDEENGIDEGAAPEPDDDFDYAEFSEYFDDDYTDTIGESAGIEFTENVKTDLFAEIHKNSLKESKALPGGNLDSKETTDYEKWLEKIHTKQDKAKVNEDEKWAPKLFDKECSENGYHDWEGKKLNSVKDFVKQYNKK